MDQQEPQKEPTFILHCNVCGDYSGGRGVEFDLNIAAALHERMNPGHKVTIKKGPDVPVK